jgi:hypothetical protein
MTSAGDETNHISFIESLKLTDLIVSSCSAEQNAANDE